MIGKEIQKRRKQLLLNQQTLADLAEISINTLVAIERDKGSVSIQNIEKVLDVLGLELFLKDKQQIHANSNRIQ